jgi:hypothetical protein
MNFDFYSKHGSLLTIIGLEVDETSVILFVIQGPTGSSLKEEKNNFQWQKRLNGDRNNSLTIFGHHSPWSYPSYLIYSKELPRSLPGDVANSVVGIYKTITRYVCVDIRSIMRDSHWISKERSTRSVLRLLKLWSYCPYLSAKLRRRHPCSRSQLLPFKHSTATFPSKFSPPSLRNPGLKFHCTHTQLSGSGPKLPHPLSPYIKHPGRVISSESIQQDKGREYYVIWQHCITIELFLWLQAPSFNWFSGSLPEHSRFCKLVASERFIVREL